MEVNYQFFVDYFLNKFADPSNRKVLDFGCGDGRIVFQMREKGFDFYGVESYYDGDEETYQRAKSNSEFIKQYSPPNDKIPYPDEYFDFIYSNQVFEHIHDLNFTLSELHRVLKKDGIMIHNFPVKEYFVEGHFRIPIIHWFKNCKNAREKLTLMFVKIGFGIHKNELNNNIYVKKVWEFIDKKCNYRTESEITEAFARFFIIKRLDKEKLNYHIQKKSNVLKNLSFVLKLIPQNIVNRIEKRRGSITILAKKIN